jgi:hypothetical protein
MRERVVGEVHRVAGEVRRIASVRERPFLILRSGTFNPRLVWGDGGGFSYVHAGHNAR